MRWALITGATSDLGRALAIALSERGYALLLTAPQEDALKSLQKQLPIETKIFPLDLRDSKARQDLIHSMFLFSPELVINNAGRGLYGPALMHETDETLDILTLNATALTHLTLEAAKILQEKRKSGVILNISSATSFIPYPTFAVYSASKNFVNTFSLAFDCEMRKEGIRILCACPGQIATGFRKKASKNRFDQQTFLTLPVEKVVKALLKQIDRRKPIQIIDWRYRILMTCLKFLPKICRDFLLINSLKKRWEEP